MKLKLPEKIKWDICFRKVFVEIHLFKNRTFNFNARAFSVEYVPCKSLYWWWKMKNYSELHSNLLKTWNWSRQRWLIQKRKTDFVVPFIRSFSGFHSKDLFWLLVVSLSQDASDQFDNVNGILEQYGRHQVSDIGPEYHNSHNIITLDIPMAIVR